MADRMREELAKLLDGYDERRRSDAVREQKTRDEAEKFLNDFVELRRSVIRPVFESAAAMLEERGHRCSIAEREFTAGAEGRVGEASITLRVVPSGSKAVLHEDQRALVIATRHYNRTVWINSGEAASAGGGLAGAKGAYTVDMLTRQLVEDEVIGFVARAVAR